MTESEVVILHKEINKLHDKMNALTGTVQEQAVTIQTQAKRIDEHTKLFAFYECQHAHIKTIPIQPGTQKIQGETG